MSAILFLLLTTMPGPGPETDIYDFEGMFEVKRGKVKQGQTLMDILEPHGVSWPHLQPALREARNIFDVRELQPSQDYSVFVEGDKPHWFVFERNPVDYVVLDLSGTGKAWCGMKPTTLRERTLDLTITGPLYEILPDERLSNHLVDLFEHRINFRKLQKGDRLKLVYEERLLNGEAIDILRIQAAHFKYRGKDVFAFYDPERDDYLDQIGRNLGGDFLRSPIRGGLVTSPYTRRRFHPVLKRYMPHLGTDFGAPIGTPVLAVGDGVIADRKRNRYNGNYVSIKHDETFTTKYLHLNGFAKGLKEGQRVRKGQLIGYVGRTGLASGAHVCLRLCRDEHQVDFRKHRPDIKASNAHFEKRHKELKAYWLQRLAEL